MQVSIVVCCYNEELLIERCIRSLLSQKTSFDIEIIVVDDCSTDATPKILKKFESEVKVLRNSKNLGIGGASQKGLEAARGQFFVRVDGDDYVSEYFIQILMLAILDEVLGRVAVCCDYYIVSEGGKRIGYVSAIERPLACGVLYNRDALLSIGGYNVAMRLFEDKCLRERFEKEFSVINIPIPLYRYRAHGGNSTGEATVLNHISN